MKKQRVMNTKNLTGTNKTSGMLLCAAFCAIAFLWTGCSNETATPGTDGRVALQVSSGIAVETRAHDDTWDARDAIGIYMLNSATAETANRKYITSAGGKNGAFAPAEAKETIYFPVDGTTRDFIAYYPYRDLAEGTTIYNVNIATQNPQQAIDLMGANRVTGKHKNAPAVAFTFAHKLVKLALTVKPESGSLTAADLEGLTVKLTNQKTQATYDVVTNGAVTVDPVATPASVTLLATAEGTSAEGIVLPNTDTQDMLLEFTLKGSDTYRWAVKEAPLSQQFEAGKKYIYTVTIGKTAIEVTSAVTDWTPGNGNGETGTAE